MVMDLSGSIPTTLGNASALETLDLSNNQLSGAIPASLGTLSNLTYINLMLNKLTGAIPESLGQLSKLETLFLEGNSLNGVLSEVHFAGLHNLKVLDLSSNTISLRVRHDWVPPFQLNYLLLHSCEVGPQFPHWLQTQIETEYLGMSNASISDSIPSWFENFSQQTRTLVLSFNDIYGKMPNLGTWQKLENLDLSNNRISGSIPSSLCKARSLSTIDLSENHFSGDIPHCLGDLKSLTYLDLSYNNLSGKIPTSIGHLSLLRILLLSNNNFHGEFLSAIKYCRSLQTLDLGNNLLTGSIPSWIGDTLLSLRILKLRSNKYNGWIPRKICYLSNLQILDVAGNNLTGTIPSCFGNFSAMLFNSLIGRGGLGAGVGITQLIKGKESSYSSGLNYVANMDLADNSFFGRISEELTILNGLIGFNLSRNQLTGSIPRNIGNMKLLESLDLSNNNLSGSIPQSLSLLSFLTYLNLSYNNLSGPIPTGNQLQTLESPSIYTGNNNLFGPPLGKNCTAVETRKSPEHHERNGLGEGGKLINQWFYIGMASGFVAGFCGVCSFFLLNKSCWFSFSKFVDDTEEKLFVLVMVRMTRLKRKLHLARN